MQKIDLPLQILLTAILFIASAAFADNSTITFQLATGVPGQKVYLAGDLSMWEANTMPMPEVTPGNYSLTVPTPWLHRVVYKFVVDGKWVQDPNNPNKLDDENGGYNSYIDLNWIEDPLLDHHSDLPRYRTTTIYVQDNEGSRRTVYLAEPPAKAYAKRKVVVYFQDGKDYLDETKITNIFENLSAMSNMPEFYGVFVPPKDRDREYGLTPSSDGYVDFMATTVVAKAEQTLKLKITSHDRLLIGPSLGGAITLYSAFMRPDVFPYAASQSGAEEITDPKLFDLMKQSPHGKPDKLFIENGVFEPADWIAYTIKARDTAKEIGVEYKYEEYPSTHDWPAWRNRLGEIFKYFFQS